MQASREPGERAVRADNAMTWDNDRQRVRRIGAAHSTRGVRAAKSGGNLAVGARFPEWNTAYGLPDRLLPRGPSKRARQCERGALSPAILRQLRARDPQVKIEVLIPDFDGNFDALETVLTAGPDVLNHNVETVPRLYPNVRPRADFERSLEILRRAAARPDPPIVKSGIMVGLGESTDEVHDVMRHIVATGCRILTIGQYLRPSEDHLPVMRFYEPAEFDALADAGHAMGFAHVESGPLVRSSYRAFDQVKKMGEIAPESDPS